MFLTKECDYGIRVIRALADGTKKSVSTIAQQEHISKSFAAKIIAKLERAGLIQSTRGRHGGYFLYKPLNSFTLCDILIAIDPHRYLNECLHKDSECPFKNHPDKPCTVHVLLGNLQGVVLDKLNALTMDKVFQKVTYTEKD